MAKYINGCYVVQYDLISTPEGEAYVRAHKDEYPLEYAKLIERDNDPWVQYKKKQAREQAEQEAKKKEEQEAKKQAEQQAKQKPKNNTVKPQKKTAKKTAKKTTLKNKQSEIDKELHACKDKKISCRISEEMYNAIAELATQFNLTFSSTVRYALSKNLSEFLGNVYFTTPEQEEKIIKYIQFLTNELRAIKNEVRRIGVNINQSTKELHILCKELHEINAEIKTQFNTAKTANERMAIAPLYQSLKAELSLLDGKIDKLEQYEKIAELLEQVNKKVVKSLWRTVVLQEQRTEQTQ